MVFEEAMSILINTAKVAQRAGALTLEEAVVVHQAIILITTPPKEQNIPKEIPLPVEEVIEK